MNWLLALCAMMNATVEQQEVTAPPSTAVIVVVGEPGEEKYEQLFVEWAQHWEETTSKADVKLVSIGPPREKSSEKEDRDLFCEMLTSFEKAPPEALWIVFIGHGTFDGKKAKFNLRGTDITATELGEQLAKIPCKTAIINCASASGPFLTQLSADNRVIVTSTQNGSEQNFARFGGYLASSVGDASADLDKDGQTSLLEAWLAASKQTQEYYETEGQLATEHALLDDNGDGKGTPYDWFRGIHLVKTSKDSSLPDGTFANQFILIPAGASSQLTDEQRKQRDQWEVELAQLRQQKASLSEEEYLSKLEKILLPLAKLYQQTKQAPK